MNANPDWLCEAAPTSSAAPPGDDGEARRRARLLDWLRDNGASTGALAISDCDQSGGLERGVRAKVELAEGTEVARIPRRLFVTADSARKSPLGQRLDAAGHAVSDRAHLASHLLELRRDQGFWAPYVDSLPSTFPGHPLGYGTLELGNLDARTAVGAVVKSVVTMARADFESVAEGLADARFDRADFDWAYACVRTRAYDLTLDGKPSHAMVPLADLLNHVDTPATLSRQSEGSDYVVSAARGIGAGEEVTATYGPYGNASLLAVYGFSLDDNPRDQACVAIAEDAFLLSRRYADETVRVLFTTLRRSTPGRLCDMRSTDGRMPCGIAHEWDCLDQLFRACDAILKRHVGCLADEDVLPRSGTGVNGGDARATALRMAIRSEQNVLWHWASLATTAGRVLACGGTDAQDRALLTCIDPVYAAEIFQLVEQQGVTT